MSSLMDKFVHATRVGVPFLAIMTADQVATMRAINGRMAQEDGTAAIVRWDITDGVAGVNEYGTAALTTVLDNGVKELTLVKMLQRVPKLPDDSILVIMNGHFYFKPDGSLPTGANIQALCNIREHCKAHGQMVVLLAPSITLPAELTNDVIVLDEALPTDHELRQIYCEVVNRVDYPAQQLQQYVSDAAVENAVHAVRGLPAFAAEQIVAFGCTDEGVDGASLWERKRQIIDSTPGLTVWTGKQRLSDLGGIAVMKDYAGMILNGKNPPRAVVLIDEIEKELSGATKGTSDSSGVSQSFLGALLRYMQNKRASGMIFIGPPGCSKSASAMAIGAEAYIPTIEMNLSGMKAGIVGQSETNMNNALKTLDAVGTGNILFIGTCNKIANLPAELRRRFTLGTFFFDLPSPEEREAIWNIYLAKYPDVKREKLTFNDEGWTGAEIAECVYKADRFGISINRAATYITPVSISAAEDIERLRDEANMRYSSASYEGVFRKDKIAQVAQQTAPVRKMKVRAQ